MKKKKTLTERQKAAKKAAQAADKVKLNKALDNFAHRKTPKQWYDLSKGCGKTRFTFGNIITRCQKKIALKAFKKKTPYKDIKPDPLFCERTFNRYIKEFEKLLLSKNLIWTIVAILSDEMFLNVIFFGA